MKDCATFERSLKKRVPCGDERLSLLLFAAACEAMCGAKRIISVSLVHTPSDERVIPICIFFVRLGARRLTFAGGALYASPRQAA